MKNQTNKDVSKQRSILDYHPKRTNQYQINMLQTNCSLNCSTQIGFMDQSIKLKLQPFKRIKLGYLHQKNNKETSIKRIVDSKKKLTIPNIIQNLQDAITVYSQESSNQQKRSEISGEVNFNQQLTTLQQQNKIQFRLFHNLRIKNVVKNSFKFAKLFRKFNRACFTQPNKQIINQKIIKINIIKETSCLAINQIGFVFHFHLYEKLPFNYSKYIQINKIGNLNFYTIQPIEKIKFIGGLKPILNKIKYVALHEPYTQTLTQYLLGIISIIFDKFCSIIQELLLRLIELSECQIYFQVQPNNVVMINQIVKIKLQINKIIPASKQAKNNAISSLGIYISSHFKLLYNIEGQKITNKFLKINLFKRLQIKNFIEDLSKNKIKSLQQAYQRSLELIR